MISLTSGSEFSTGGCGFELSLLRSPRDTGNDIGHGSTAIGAENLDGNEVCLLGDTILARSNGTGTVRTVTVAVLIFIVGWDGFPPGGATLEFFVVDVDTGIDDVNVNTLATVYIIYIAREIAEGKFAPVANTSETLWEQN